MGKDDRIKPETLVDQDKTQQPRSIHPEMPEASQTGERSGLVEVGELEDYKKQDREDVIDRGKHFLLDASLKDAALTDKKLFLESKGLSRSEISRALALAHNVESVKENASMHSTSQKTVAQSSYGPPIITYPEFLIHAQRPKPVITASRLLNTTYAGFAATTMFYGISSLFVAPMQATLTEMRQDFANYTYIKLANFISELRKIQSINLLQPLVHEGRELGQDVADAMNSGPEATELFHRDFGTQTTFDSSIDDKVHPLQSTNVMSGARTSKTTVDHANTVSELVSQCRSLTRDVLADAQMEDKETLASLRTLHEYLESVAYTTYNSNGIYGFGIPAPVLSGDTEGRRNEDEVTKFRNEIRGVKGTLLSARNFPGRRASGFPSVVPSQTSRESTTAAR